MYDPSWHFGVHGVLFLVSGVCVAVAGISLSANAARLSRLTGLGQAMTGALFLGASTSLSGIITSVAAAANGHPELAAGNAVGGIAAQTVFLAAADGVYRKANLEHAAASDENMLQGALLIVLLATASLAAVTPAYSIRGVHPVSLLIPTVYVFGQRLIHTARGRMMWQPRLTEHTQTEAESETSEKPRTDESKVLPGIRFAVAAGVITVAGYLLAQSGVAIAERTGLNETVVGGLFTAVATSFPELITAVAAVRIGALTMAVSNIMGGNAFDVLFLAVADIAYREGSVYHAMGSRPLVLIILAILLTSILLLGLIRRQKHGIANIGFESVLLIVVYLGGFLLILTGMDSM